MVRGTPGTDGHQVATDPHCCTPRSREKVYFDNSAPLGPHSLSKYWIRYRYGPNKKFHQLRPL